MEGGLACQAAEQVVEVDLPSGAAASRASPLGHPWGAFHLVGAWEGEGWVVEGACQDHEGNWGVACLAGAYLAGAYLAGACRACQGEAWGREGGWAWACLTASRLRRILQWLLQGVGAEPVPAKARHLPEMWEEHLRIADEVCLPGRVGFGLPEDALLLSRVSPLSSPS